MGFFSDIWNSLLEGLESILRLYEGLLEPVVGQYAWGLSIILLTVTVRIFLIPLMVRQTKSMRGMQKIQPELKKIQAKYKADPQMRKTDPERFQKLKEKQREAQMSLYKDHQVNPVGGCLPLILQMPIFFALFRVLQPTSGGDLRIPELEGAPFFGIDSLTGTAAAGVGIGAIVLVVLQVVTTFYSQKQMQARNATAGGEQAQAQKIIMYVMPAFLGWLSFTFPIGVVLYWVTTNFWTIGQQAVIFRKVEADEAEEEASREAARKAERKQKGSGSSRPKGSKDQSGDVTRGTRSGGSSNGSAKKAGSKNGKGSPEKRESGPAAKKKKSSGSKSNRGSSNGSTSTSRSGPEKGSRKANGTPGPTSERNGSADSSKTSADADRAET